MKKQYKDEQGLIYERLMDKTLSVIKCTSEEEKIIIPNDYKGMKITTIGSHAFERCISLKSIEIGDSVCFIQECAFKWCNALQEVTMGQSVSCIDNKAFYGCDSLIRIVLSLPFVGTLALLLL